jgi:trimeric autotransporter adhesin
MKARDLAAALLLLLVALMVSATPSRGSVRTSGRTAARPTRRVQPVRVWVTDGNVGALTATAHGLFAGGDFTLVGPRTGSWVRVSATGQVPPVRRPLEGDVTAAVGDGRGGWYLAGGPFYVDNAVRRALIHLRAGGRLDKSWKPRIRGSVSALARVGSTLYFGGDFTRVGRRKRLELAALDIKTGALKRWAPKVKPAKHDSADVFALQPGADGKTIYVGGYFARLGHKRRSNLGAVSAKTGSVRRWHPAVNDDVYALAIDPRRRSIYVGGDFTKAGGQKRAGLAAFNRRGVATRWDPGCDGSISQIVPAPSGSPIYVAGEFASIGEKSRRGLAALDRNRGAATSWDPNVAGSVDAMLLSSSKHTVYIGGEFDSVGDADRSNLAAVNTQTGVATSWNAQTIGTVSVLARMRGGALEVGGELSSVGAFSRSKLALFGLDGSLSNWAPQLGGTAVRAIAASPDGSRVYIGGRFTLDNASRSLAAVNTDTLAISPWGPSISSGVWAIAPSPDGQTVYVGGSFTSAAGQTRRRLAAFDANGTLTSWQSRANGLVRQLVLSGDQLWAAGDFGSIGGDAHQGVASLDVSTGLATGWDAGADNNVTALAVSGDNVFVGGNFETIGGRSRKYLAELDAADGTATRWDPSPDDAVNAIGLSPDGKSLVVVGDFLKLSGARRDIGEFDPGTGLLTSWNPSAPFSADSLAFSPDSTTLYAGGDGELAIYH